MYLACNFISSDLMIYCRSTPRGHIILQMVSSAVDHQNRLLRKFVDYVRSSYVQRSFRHMSICHIYCRAAKTWLYEVLALKPESNSRGLP